MLTRARRVLALRLGLFAWGLAATCLSGLDPERRITQYAIRSWSIDDDLPQSSVYALLQTRDGYLWLGTGEGLARFDGERFVVFDSGNTEAMINNRVDALAEDAEGALWVGTRGGLLRRDASGFVRFSETEGLPDDAVQALLATPGGELWIGTARGLARWSGGRFERFGRREGLPDEVVLSLARDVSGAIWVGTVAGLARRGAGGWRTFGDADGLPSPIVQRLLADPDGSLWVGTAAGLCRFAGERCQPVAALGPTPQPTIAALARDRDGQIWVGGYAGLARLAPRSADAAGRLDQTTGLPYDAVVAILEDADGQLWLGTDGGGLARLVATPAVVWGRAEGLATEMVWTVLETRDGAIWAGTDGGGLARLDGGALASFGRANGLPSEVVFSLFEDRAGDLWVGTDDGVAVGGPDGFRPAPPTESGRLVGPVFGLGADSEGRLLVGSAWGLYRLEQGRLRRLVDEVGLAGFDGAVTCFHAAADGSLWVGTNGAGLRRRRRDGALERYDGAEGLGRGFAIAFHEDPDGTLWIATDVGLFRFRAGRFAAVGRRQGLPTERVFRILVDATERFWLPTNKGVVVVGREALERAADGGVLGQVELVGRPAGLRSPEANGGKPGGWRARDGRIWIPTVAGLTAIDPNRIPPSTEPPITRIDRVSAGDLARIAGAPIRLPPGVRDLEVEISAPALATPERLRFRTRLVGIDASWRETRDRVVRFSSLPPGELAFEAAASFDGVAWGPAARLELLAPPRLFERPGLVAIAALALVALGAALATAWLQRARRRAGRASPG